MEGKYFDARGGVERECFDVRSSVEGECFDAPYLSYYYSDGRYRKGFNDFTIP